jgi:hypothetical protein
MLSLSKFGKLGMKANAETPRTNLHVSVGDTVWMLYRNATEAARIRKSGHGEPWRHSYRVVAVQDYTAKLEPLHGSMEVSNWQPLHKLSKSPPKFVDHDFDIATEESGLTLAPGVEKSEPLRAPRSNWLESPEYAEAPPDDDGLYEVEDIIKAYKLKGTWYVTVKWKGWCDTTEEPRRAILEDAGSDVKRWVRQACAAYTRGDHEIAAGGNDEISSDSDEGEVVDDAKESMANVFMIDSAIRGMISPAQLRDNYGTLAESATIDGVVPSSLCHIEANTGKLGSGWHGSGLYRLADLRKLSNPFISRLQTSSMMCRRLTYYRSYI